MAKKPYSFIIFQGSGHLVPLRSNVLFVKEPVYGDGFPVYKN